LYNDTLEKTKDKDVFSTWEWLSCWWKHFGKGRDLKILIAQEKDEILGVAPLMLSKYSFLHMGKLQKLEFIGSPHSDYNSFVLLKKEKECLKLFLKHLMEFSEWDLLELSDVREGSVSANLLDEASKNRTTKLELRIGTLCPYVNLPASNEDFANGLSRNMRKNLRKGMRKLSKKYKVEVKTQKAYRSTKEAMEAFFKLHQKRWRSKGERGAFASEVFRNFHLDLAEVFDKKGWLSLRFLMANSKPIAAVYSFDYNLKKYGYLSGFDPDFGHYTVGNLLKLVIVEECIKKRFREYDLARGFEPYKANWATGVRRNFVATIVGKSVFAEVYDWAVQNHFSQLLIDKLRFHLQI
jgi:CelD/BcsL family acetyltransferase involved in cellulose biosynthesis